MFGLNSKKRARYGVKELDRLVNAQLDAGCSGLQWARMPNTGGGPPWRMFLSHHRPRNECQQWASASSSSSFSFVLPELRGPNTPTTGN